MRTRVWAGFAALCVLAGSEWIVNLAMPRLLPGLFGLGIRLLVLGILFILCDRRTVVPHLSLGLPFWGALFLAPLPLAFAGADGHVSSLTEFLSLAFLPAGFAFFQTQLQDPGQNLQQLVPALAGAGGAALLIAYTVPTTLVGRFWLLAIAGATLLTGLAGIRLHALLQQVTAIQGTARICAGAAVLSLLTSFHTFKQLPHPDAHVLALAVLRMLVIDAPVVFLTVWTLRLLAPTQFSAKYLLTLFIALAESFLIARASFDWTVAIGCALMLGASISLLRSPEKPLTSVYLFRDS